MTATGSPRLFAPAKLLDRKFQNPVPTMLAASGRTLHLMRRWIREGRRGLPAKPIGPFPADVDLLNMTPQTGLRMTWFGHSSLLIEIDGRRILTDPVWSNRASFVPFAGPKRFYPPSLPLESLPPLDAVLLSHDHYDHLDSATIRRLTSQPVRFVCSLGMSRHLESWGVKSGRIVELNWGESTQLPGSIEIIATPARHFSGRTLWGRNRTLWSSFVIRTPQRAIFFGGDSGFFPGFREIGEHYGPFDLTMLEIGAYDADWPEVHMGPENATKAHLALRGRLMLPIHWGLFNLAFHPWQEPVERLLEIAAEKQIQLLLPRPGVPVEVTGANLNSGWWAA